MKKLMIAAAIVCAATMSQAVAFKWQSSDEGMAIAVDSIKGKGNGNYSVGSTSMDGVGTFTYVLSIYAEGTYGTEDQKLIGSTSGDVAFNSSSGKWTFGGNKDVSGTVVNTTYDYVLAITGSQSNIRALGDKVAATDGNDGTYDYTAAQLAWTAEGSIKTKSSGATQLTDLPTSFQVSGITFTAAPEPTSGLLLLIGVGALALRRRRA